MANGIKGITVEIGGDTQGLDKALKDVNKTINATQSELRQVEKALKLDPNNVTLVAQKQKLLKDEIATTKEKLESLQAAQKQVTAQYKAGEIDGGQYRAFQRELETTKAKLKSLEEQKSSVSVIGAAFGTVKEKVQEVQEKMEPLANGLKKVASAAKDITAAGIQAVGKAVNVAVDGLKMYAGAAIAAGTAAVGLAVKGAAAADDINTIAAQTGLSTEQIQKFQYAAEVIDVPLETLTGSMAKLTRNMSSAQKGTGNAAEAFQALGVSITDSNGQLRNNQDVFNEAIAALSKMENETQRDAYAMAIFGKSAQDLNPLIKGGAETLKELGDSAAAAGLILSQEALDHLNEFNDSLDILKANASQSGNILGGVFSGALKGVTDVIGQSLPGITNAVAGIFSGNMDAAGKKLTESLTSVFRNLINQARDQLPGLLEGFNQLLISLFTAIATTLPDALNVMVPALLNGFFGLIQGLIPLIPTLLPTIVEAAMQLFTGILTGLEQTLPLLVEMLPGIIDSICNTIVANLPLIIKSGIQILISLIQGITNSIPSLIQAVIALIPVIVQALIDNLPALVDAGLQLIVALAEGLPLAIPAIIKAIPGIIKAIIDTLMSQDWLAIGIDIIKGIAAGLLEGVKAIGSVIAEVGSYIVSGFKSFFGIASPSKLFANVVGKNLALGIEQGFTDNVADVMHSIYDAIPDIQQDFPVPVDMPIPIIPAPAPSKPAQADADMSGGGPRIVIHNHGDNIIREDADIDRVAERLYAKVRAEKRARGEA